MPSRQDSLNPKPVEMLQVKDNTTRRHPKANTSDEVLQEMVELEKVMEVPRSQEMEILILEKNESSEDFTQVLFEE